MPVKYSRRRSTRRWRGGAKSSTPGTPKRSSRRSSTPKRSSRRSSTPKRSSRRSSTLSPSPWIKKRKNRTRNSSSPRPSWVNDRISKKNKEKEDRRKFFKTQGDFVESALERKRKGLNRSPKSLKREQLKISQMQNVPPGLRELMKKAAQLHDD